MRRYPEADYYPQSWRGIKWLIRDTLRDVARHNLCRLRRRLGLLPKPSASPGILTPYNLEPTVALLRSVPTPIRDRLARTSSPGLAARFRSLDGTTVEGETPHG